MAIMIPSKPRDFKSNSQEDLMFNALSLLPNDYFVIHSFRAVSIEDNEIKESETDFVIYNKNRGILCIEAKAGRGIRYENGEWLYTNGDVMSHNGPYNQAANEKYKLRDIIKKSKMPGILDRCKLAHAVWFPGINFTSLRSISLPPEAHRDITLVTEDLADPTSSIERIFAINTYYNHHDITETDLSETEDRYLLRNILCPEFNVFPTASFDRDLKEIAFHRLLKEQMSILNFLDEQKTVAISGAAGTGKTVIAVEKATRLANSGSKVLFLCYNRKLKDYLAEHNKHQNIDFYTIDGLACKICKTNYPNYTVLAKELETMYYRGTFPYEHVIIDEGQDFGKEDLDEIGPINTLRNVLPDNGSFYVFYDKLQMVQSEKLPDFIEDTDCRLSLYRNCRNTINIATTSLRPIGNRQPVVSDFAITGKPVKIYFAGSEHTAETVDAIISAYKDAGIRDIVILTCKTEESSSLSSCCKNGLYKNRYQFTTCRKFKGLEADAVIVVDVEKDTFDGDHAMLFYVASSRARLCLDIVADMSDMDCEETLRTTFNREPKKNKIKQEFASALNAIVARTVTNTVDKSDK